MPYSNGVTPVCCRRHTAKSEFSLERVQSLPYVDVLYIHTGIRPGLANALVALGAKGIVVASVGAGSPGNLDKEIGEILKNGSAVVVQSSRVGEGRIVRNNNWHEPGMVVADNLSPQKAAILLSLALSKTSIRNRFSDCSTNIDRAIPENDRGNERPICPPVLTLVGIGRSLRDLNRHDLHARCVGQSGVRIVFRDVLGRQVICVG
jgi:hypothetical protein